MTKSLQGILVSDYKSGNENNRHYLSFSIRKHILKPLKFLNLLTVAESAHLKPGLARVQWTNENNICLAKESMRFIREIELELAVLGERKVDINFTPQVNFNNNFS